LRSCGDISPSVGELKYQRHRASSAAASACGSGNRQNRCLRRGGGGLLARAGCSLCRAGASVAKPASGHCGPVRRAKLSRNLQRDRGATTGRSARPETHRHRPAVGKKSRAGAYQGDAGGQGEFAAAANEMDNPCDVVAMSLWHGPLRSSNSAQAWTIFRGTSHILREPAPLLAVIRFMAEIARPGRNVRIHTMDRLPRSKTLYPLMRVDQMSAEHGVQAALTVTFQVERDVMEPERLEDGR